MDKKLRVGIVNYLNTKPLVYGLGQGLMKERVELVFDYPSKVADYLLNDEIDIGLVPVAIIPEMKEYHIISDYCIASDGEVSSVCLFSEVPLEQIKTVLLDYQSRTSVALVKILLKEYWKITPVFLKSTDTFMEDIKGTTAAVVIGDRALKQKEISPYVYDLGTAWKAYTGMPFVFAAWVSNKPISAEFIKLFNEANQVGIDNLEVVVQKYSPQYADLMKYYTQFIKFKLDRSMHESIAIFLNKLKSGE